MKIQLCLDSGILPIFRIYDVIFKGPEVARPEETVEMVDMDHH